MQELSKKKKGGQTGGVAASATTPVSITQVAAGTPAAPQQPLGALKGSFWMMTINNPTQDEIALSNKPTDPRWNTDGQLERGENGTVHLQFRLHTHQCRGTEVKRMYPRAHIELCRNEHASKRYCEKEETRVSPLATSQVTPHSALNIFTAQSAICKALIKRDLEAEYDAELVKISNLTLTVDKAERVKKLGDVNRYVSDQVKIEVKRKIEDGENLWEIIASNPMWHNSWLAFGPSILKRSKKYNTDAEVQAHVNDGQDIEGYEYAPEESASSPASDGRICEEGDGSSCRQV